MHVFFRIAYLLVLSVLCVTDYSYGAAYRPKGLPNVGLTCYLNALLQGLMVTPLFDVLSKQGAACSSDSFSALLKEFINLYDTSADGVDAHALRDIYTRLSRVMQLNITLNSFGDVSPCFYDIIDRLDRTAVQGCLLPSCLMRIKNTITCSNNHVLERVETEAQITVYFMQKSELLDIKKGISTIFSGGKIDGYQCSVCDKKTDAIKQSFLCDPLPEWLSISGSFDQNSFVRKQILVPSAIDLGYVIHDSCRRPDAQRCYSLCAIILWYSSHYVALVCRNDVWYLCNDASITVVPLFQKSSDELFVEQTSRMGMPCMLFYKKCHDTSGAPDPAPSAMTALGELAYHYSLIDLLSRVSTHASS